MNVLLQDSNAVSPQLTSKKQQQQFRPEECESVDVRHLQAKKVIPSAI